MYTIKDFIFLITPSFCVKYSTFTYVFGCIICFGAILGYVPQLITLIRSKSIKGFSELSAFLMCLSLSTLTLNTLILNWWRWSCFTKCTYQHIKLGFCFLNMLSVFQIGTSWIMASFVYILFMRTKVCTSKQEQPKKFYVEIHENGDIQELDELNESDESNEPSESNDSEEISLETFERTFKIIPKWAMDWTLFGIYVLFILIIIIISVLQKTINQNSNFFIGFAYAMGIISSIASCVMWLPQIIHLIRKKEDEGLSILMFILQAPGSIIVVIFQAVIYQQPVITWMPYAINAIEQFIVIGLLIWIKIRNNEHPQTTIFDDSF